MAYEFTRVVAKEGLSIGGQCFNCAKFESKMSAPYHKRLNLKTLRVNLNSQLEIQTHGCDQNGELFGISAGETLSKFDRICLVI